MAYQNVFRRCELKYLISRRQEAIIRQAMAPYMREDTYGKSVICNLYLDTPDYRLIRRSLEAPVYKEKLRIRSYGAVSPGDTVFLELKKKYDGVVYKRRASMTEAQAMAFGGEENPGHQTQIMREIAYVYRFYADLRPRMFISYDREAFFADDDLGFRITFDENIRWRTDDLSLCSAPGGRPLMDDGTVLMEIKTGVAIPLWLTKVLSRERLYKTSFSKYGAAYTTLYQKTSSGGICCVE